MPNPHLPNIANAFPEGADPKFRNSAMALGLEVLLDYQLLGLLRFQFSVLRALYCLRVNLAVQVSRGSGQLYGVWLLSGLQLKA